MNESIAYLLLVLGFVLFCTGCRSPLGTATASANVAAHTLRAAHAQLGQQYKADQVKAASRVTGDRSDPAIKTEQRNRVAAVRARYRPIWDGYAIAYEAWLEVVSAIEVAQQVDGAGGALDLVTITDLLRVLLTSQRRWVALVRQHGEAR